MTAWLLEVAGTRSVVHIDEPEVPAWPAPYSEFLSQLSGDTAEADLEIRVRATERLEGLRDDGRVEFASTGWYLLRKVPGYCFGQGPDPNNLFAVATVDEEFRKVDVQLIKGELPDRQMPWVVLQLFPRILLIHLMLLRDRGVLLHAAGMELDGNVFLFPGRSGAGKTTLSRLFRTHQEVRILSDDRMIIGECPTGLQAWGTPWPGELGVAVNQNAPLKGIFFLHKGDRSHISELSGRQGLEQLLPVISIPWYDRELVARGTDFCERIINRTPLYQLHFRPDESAVAEVLSHVS